MTGGRTDIFRTVIVAATPRSGSSMLGQVMASTGCLGKPAEYFEPDRVPGTTPVDRCRLVLTEGRSANGVVATKLFPLHFDWLRRDVRLSDWFPDPLWVHLRRRDLLGQAISLAIAMQDRAWKSNDTPVGSAVYSREGIERALKQLAEPRWPVFFARHGIEPLELVYEDLGDAGDACRMMADRLGVTLTAMPAPPMLLRQRGAVNEAWRRRFIAEAGNPDDFDGRVPEARRRWRFWRRP